MLRWAHARFSSPALRAPARPLATSRTPPRTTPRSSSRPAASSARTRRTTRTTTRPSPTTQRPHGGTAARPTSTTSASTSSASRRRCTRASAIYARRARNAGKPQISGFNAAGAWKVERGRPDVVDRDPRHRDQVGPARRCATQIHLNTGELPLPNATAHADLRPRLGAGGLLEHANAYDANGDGAFNVDDYAATRASASAGRPRTGPPALDAEDLIHAFSDGTDDDGNGFVDDIAGWDFFDNDNDPLRRLELLRRRQPRHRPRRRTRPSAGNDGAGRDRRLPALPDHAAADLGHVRLRPQHVRAGDRSTPPTTAPR